MFSENFMGFLLFNFIFIFYLNVVNEILYMELLYSLYNHTM